MASPFPFRDIEEEPNHFSSDEDLQSTTGPLEIVPSNYTPEPTLRVLANSFVFEKTVYTYEGKSGKSAKKEHTGLWLLVAVSRGVQKEECTTYSINDSQQLSGMYHIEKMDMQADLRYQNNVLERVTLQGEFPPSLYSDDDIYEPSELHAAKRLASCGNCSEYSWFLPFPHQHPPQLDPIKYTMFVKFTLKVGPVQYISDEVRIVCFRSHSVYNPFRASKFKDPALGKEGSSGRLGRRRFPSTLKIFFAAPRYDFLM